MQSLHQVYNRAIARVGGDQLPVGVDFSGDATGVICVNEFPHVLETALSAYSWSFALARKVLVKASGGQDPATPRWRFRYNLPANCMRVVRLDGELERNAPPVHMVEGADLLTDQDDAVLIYVDLVDAPSRWPGYFVQALVWGLAAELASARVNDPAKQQWFAEKFEQAIQTGISLDVTQQPPRMAAQQSGWGAARFGRVLHGGRG